MSRSRNIKPGFFKNEAIAELPYEFRLLFIGLWCEADREGRLEDRPVKLKMSLFPADALDVNAGLCALQESGFIFRYESSGKKYIQVVEFKKHQNPHFREQMSQIPSPESLGLDPRQMTQKPEALPVIDDMEAPGFLPDAPQHVQQCEYADDAKAQGFTPIERGVSLKQASLIPDSRFPIPDSLQDQEHLSDEGKKPKSRFAEFWAAYPVKKGKAEAEKKWALHKLDAIADVIIADVRERITQDRDWVEGYIPHGSTYVNGKGWQDGMKPLNGLTKVNGSHAPSKTLTAIQALEEMKNANLDRTRNRLGLPEAPDLELGAPASRRLNQRDRDDLV